MLYGKDLWYGEKPLEKALKLADKLGFDFIELSIDYPWPEKIRKEEVKILKNYDLAFHAPWVAICLAHPQKEIFDASLKIVRKALIFSSKFNPLYFSFHITAPFHGTFKLDEIAGEILKKGVEAAKSLSKTAEDLGIKICVENNPEIFFGSPKQIELVLSSCENLYFNFDIPHSIVAEYEIKRKENPFRKEKTGLKTWFSRFNDKILTIHLSDIKIKNGEPKDHYPIGDGILKLENILSLVKKTSCNYILLEIFRKDKGKIGEKDFEKSLKKVRGLMNDRNKL